MKSDCYEITVTERRMYKVSFDEPVTFQEAKDMFLECEYGDVVDEQPLETLYIDRVVSIGE